MQAESSEFGDVRFVSQRGELRFRHPSATIKADTPAEVPAALDRLRDAVENGHYAAGFLAYEAAPAFDPAFVTHPPSSSAPIMWFGVYNRCEELPPPPLPAARFNVGEWRSHLEETDYYAALAKIRDYIAAGDTYQVNYAMPLSASFEGDPLAWFRHLCMAQGSNHNAYVDLGGAQVLSASPELFFELDGARIVTRPMKGTHRRGRYSAEDQQFRRNLLESEKDRAENLMITDLLRNDLGRISEIGSVTVERLFEAERYETLWQMTSTISGQTSADPPRLLHALFPSGSITGAPKARTMEIIRELEQCPRGVYCGSIGWWGPGRQASFNVAIRTVTVDAQRGEAHCHVGGGVTWDSRAALEYEECRSKAVFLSYKRPVFELLETLLLQRESYYLLDEHMQRLLNSAAYFGYPVEESSVREALHNQQTELLHGGATGPHKVRLLLDGAGGVRTEAAPVTANAEPARVALAPEPVDRDDVFLYHKTTHRAVYEAALSACPGYDDVILWNQDGDLTESVWANLVIEQDGRFLTPPVDSGLLAGCMRAALLHEGRIEEARLARETLETADRVWLINSVRRWMPVAGISLKQSDAKTVQR